MDLRMALTGFGNVGQGVAALLRDQGESYQQRYGVRLLLTAVADRGGAVIDPGGLDPSELLWAKKSSGSIEAHTAGEPMPDHEEFMRRSGAAVLLEAASTNFTDAEPGWSYTQVALKAGMDVILASKGALVVHWAELMRLAQQHNRRVLFSATVGAPLPVFEVAERALAGATITGIAGVVNATSNQILASMAGGQSYEQGVRAAQELGIAETNPTLDVDGWDAAAKAVILANSLLGAQLTLSDVRRTGIRDVTGQDLESAARAGDTIKLIAELRVVDGAVTAEVHPDRRPRTDVLGALTGAEMGIIFYTEPLGRVAATVQHTGGVPTALTVLRDVFTLARDRGWGTPKR